MSANLSRSDSVNYKHHYSESSDVEEDDAGRSAHRQDYQWDMHYIVNKFCCVMENPLPHLLRHGDVKLIPLATDNVSQLAFGWLWVHTWYVHIILSKVGMTCIQVLVFKENNECSVENQHPNYRIYDSMHLCLMCWLKSFINTFKAAHGNILTQSWETVLNHTSVKIKLTPPAYSHTTLLLVSSLNFSLPTLGWLLQEWIHDDVKGLNGGLRHWRVFGSSVAACFSSPNVHSVDFASF